jgi:ubiquinone/menaquinone biosynthesis C-methylase UbiE
MKQADSSHYAFLRYMRSPRWACYYIQIKKTLLLAPARVLEIGPGDGIYGWYLKKNGVHYESVDHADDIESNYKVEFGKEPLPLPDSSFDVVSAFQVLEHIPFEEFEKTLIELARVSSRYVFLDIPQYGFHLNLAFKIPCIRFIAMHAVVPRPVRHVFDGFHYWEIGKRGYSRRRVRDIIERHFRIIEEFSIFEKPSERFYILEVKKKGA